MSNEVHIRVIEGDLRGESINDRVMAFRGIHYAASPVGTRRFRAPEPPPKFDGVKDCVKRGGTCPQLALPYNYLAPIVRVDPATFDEANCLNLDVWAPFPCDGKRPVMVFIPGGAFSMGSGTLPMYEGNAFVESGVVYVSVSYRVGPLGWLFLDESFDNATGTGNLGLLDQIAALQWVKDNIAAFGGDAENVTIFGESAGGISVATLIGTPKASGLFQRAIVQSGSARQNFKASTAQRITDRILAGAGVKAGDWDALRSAPAQNLIDATLPCFADIHTLLDDESGGVRHMGIVFSPVIDGIVLPDSSERLVAKGQAAGVDLLVGICADEVRGFRWGQPSDSFYAIERDFQEFLSPLKRTDQEVRTAYRSIERLKTDQDISAAVATDATFGVPTAQLAANQLKHRDRVWFYRLEWQTPLDNYVHGTPHALDLPFVFKHLDVDIMHGPNPPESLAVLMHHAWVQFATTGDPNGGEFPDWPSYNLETRAVMIFDERSRVGTDFSPEIRAVWDIT